MLPKFTRLVIAHNKLSELDDLIHLVNCKQLSVLDLQHNQIKDPIVVEEVFAKMPSLVSHFLELGEWKEDGFDSMILNQYPLRLSFVCFRMIQSVQRDLSMH